MNRIAENQLDDDFDSCFDEWVDTFATDASRLERRGGGRSARGSRGNRAASRAKSATNIKNYIIKTINLIFITSFVL